MIAHQSGPDPAGTEIRAVEARIAIEMARLVDPRRLRAQVVPPPPYVRRHVVEHAAAGEVLDDRFLTAEFLPFVDAARLRPLHVPGDDRQRRPDARRKLEGLLRAWRQVAYCWDWHQPSSNSDALSYSMRGLARQSVPQIGTVWRTAWRHGSQRLGEVIARLGPL